MVAAKAFKRRAAAAQSFSPKIRLFYRHVLSHSRWNCDAVGTTGYWNCARGVVESCGCDERLYRALPAVISAASPEQSSGSSIPDEEITKTWLQGNLQEAHALAAWL